MNVGLAFAPAVHHLCVPYGLWGCKPLTSRILSLEMDVSFDHYILLFANNIPELLRQISALHIEAMSVILLDGLLTCPLKSACGPWHERSVSCSRVLEIVSNAMIGVHAAMQGSLNHILSRPMIGCVYVTMVSPLVSTSDCE